LDDSILEEKTGYTSVKNMLDSRLSTLEKDEEGRFLKHELNGKTGEGLRKDTFYFDNIIKDGAHEATYINAAGLSLDDFYTNHAVTLKDSTGFSKPGKAQEP
jgi:hypothetical protein